MFHKLDFYRNVEGNLTLSYTDSLYGEDKTFVMIEGDWYESIYNEGQDCFEELYVDDIGIELGKLLRKLENQP